ncbi:MFS transporter [Prauserella halophila]|uniref:MFS transporter n=1 Tax=Prauserella halophila TaxID=185641 RepID=A0ABN1WAK3_9PSEU|nr:hypothetical protein [Prauserella halophila]
MIVELALSEGGFATAQLALPLIGVVVLAYNGRIYTAIGAQRQAFLSALLLLGGMVVIGAIPHVVGLVVGLLLCGLGSASLDAATNAAAIDLERETGRHYLSFMHGFQAGAALLGAAAASGLFALGWEYPAVAIVTTAAVCLPTAVVTLCVRFAVTGDPEEVEEIPSSLWRNSTFVRLVLLCLVGSAAEAIATVWAVIYLQEGGTSIAVAGAVFGGFNGAMIVGRFANGPLIEAFGARVSLWVSGSLMAVSGLLLLTAPNEIVSAVGVVLLGLAVAGVQPSTISAAGTLGSNSGAAASGIMLSAYLALVIAPFVYGWVADWTSLASAMSIVALCGVVGTLLVAGLPKGGRAGASSEA